MQTSFRPTDRRPRALLLASLAATVVGAGIVVPPSAFTVTAQDGYANTADVNDD